MSAEPGSPDFRSPSQAIVSEATAAISVVDQNGRRLDFRKMSVLDRLRLFKAAGPTLAQNGPWLGIAVLACSVTAIDGVPVPMPGNEQQIESLVAKLGDAGIAAVASAFAATPDPSAVETRRDAGNSAGTPI